MTQFRNGLEDGVGDVDPMDLDPWERQPNESENAWVAFQAYRDLDPPRSLKRAGAVIGKGSRYCESLSSTWKWQKRVQAYERYLDAQRRKEFAEANKAVEVRQRATMEDASAVLAAPIEAFLKKAREYHERGEELFDQLTTAQLQALAIEAVRYLPQLIQTERLVTGLSIDPSGAGGAHGGKEEAIRALESASRDELERILYGEGERDDGRAAQLEAAGVDPVNPA